MSRQDVIDAKRSLEIRLRDWGVGDRSTTYAAEFIDSMVSRGWQMSPARELRRPNPRPHEVCGKHPGQYRLSCGGCRADREAVDAGEQPPSSKADAATVRAIAATARVAAQKRAAASEGKTK